MTLIAYTIHTWRLRSFGLPAPVVLCPVVLDPPSAEIREAAENAITRTEMRERRMIVSRTSLIRICADHRYLTAHGLFTGMTENS